MTLKQEPTLPTSQDHIDANTPMGANLVTGGATFRAWAPRAKARHVLGDFNGWTLNRFSPWSSRPVQRDGAAGDVTTVMDALSIYRPEP